MDVAIEEEDAKHWLSLAFGITFAFCGVISIIFIPIFVRALTGVKRIYIILQQFCIFLHQIFVGLPSLIPKQYDHFMSLMEFGLQDEILESYLSILSSKPLLADTLLRILESLCQYEYYLLSMMQSMDVFKMVTDPFRYKEYSSTKNVLGYLLKGTVGCFFLTLDSIAILFVKPLALQETFKTGVQGIYGKIMYGISIVKFVKSILFKMIYSIIIVNIAIMTKNSLENDTSLSPDDKRKTLRKRLFYFMLIPLFVHVLYLSHEIVDWLCHDLETEVMEFEELSLLKLVTLSIGSLAYVLGYIVIFPKARKAFTCKHLVQN